MGTVSEFLRDAARQHLYYCFWQICTIAPSLLYDMWLRSLWDRGRISFKMRGMLRAIGLLLASNVFMNIAWYGHLKFKESPLWMAILASWGIAFFEYCLQVPANRIGAETLSASQLKVIQEALSMGTFIVFAAIALKEPIKWNTILGFIVVLVGVGIMFMGGKDA